MRDVDWEKIAVRMKDLQALMNQMSEIRRMIYMPDTDSREDYRENDSEHSFHLAIHAWYISQSLPELDQEKVIKYALAHDIVEVYAGDSMALGRTDKEQAVKEEKEQASRDRLREEWPDFTEMIDAMEAYELQKDKEAVFVKALDKMMAVLHQVMSSGRTWKEYDIARQTVLELKAKKTAKSPEIAAIWEHFRKDIESHDDWFNEGKAA